MLEKGLVETLAVGHHPAGMEVLDLVQVRIAAGADGDRPDVNSDRRRQENDGDTLQNRTPVSGIRLNAVTP